MVLAGGTGSRLFPLTKVTNKHLLPVGRYPMIYHAVAKLADAGIRDVLIVTGTEHVGTVVGTLGSGRALGLELTYRVQDRPGGIAEALGLARNFLQRERCVVILGDNIFSDSIQPYVSAFGRQVNGAKILLKQVPDPGRFGVAEVVSGTVVSIEEKPDRPKSGYAVTGIYMYDERVTDVIAELQPSARGELEITDVNNFYLKDGSLTCDVLQGWWTDAGTFASLAIANELASHVRLDVFDSSDRHRPHALVGP